MAIQDFGPAIEQAQKFNEIIKEQIKLLEKRDSLSGSQARTSREVADAMSESADASKKAALGQGELSGAAEKAVASQKGLKVGISDTDKALEEHEKFLGGAAKAAGAFGDALSSAASGAMGLVKIGGNLVGMLFDVGLSIAKLPFALWDAFVEKSMNMPYNPAFAQMKEDVREMFGSLKAGAGKEVMDGYRELRSEMGKMSKETGLGMQRIFGYGVDGKAAMLGFIKDMSQGLGSQLGPIMSQIGDQIGEVTYAIKGMGLSSEESGAAMKFFYNSGQNASKMLQDMGKTAAMMAKETGFNIKTLSKAMVETTSAFPQFAKGGVKAMAQVAHYTHNLGIEVKDLQAVFDKFDSFEGAAESASQLSQAFGVNIDAMKMVKEQDPTKRLEAMRNAFKAAGKDINSMTSAERKLAEQTVGLSGAAFEAALGEGNKKKSLTESEKAAQAATRAAKDQTKAMRELADSIKRIIPPQGEKFQGFFDAFNKGFAEGMFRSENLRQMFVNLQATFRQAYYFGKQLAQLLFDNFPGMDKLAKGFTELFNPAKFRKFFDGVMKEFRLFFSAVQSDPKAGLKTLVENIKSLFSEVFGGTGTDSALNSIKEGMKTIISTLGKLIGEGLRMLMSLAADGMKNLAQMIRDPKAVMGAMGEAGGVGASFFGPIIEGIQAALPGLLLAAEELLGTLWRTVKKAAVEWWNAPDGGKAMAGQIWDEYWPYFVGYALLRFGGPLVSLVGGIANMTGGAFKLLANNPQILSGIKTFASSIGVGFSNFMNVSNSPILQSLSRFFPNLIPRIAGIFSGALPLLKGLVSKIPIIGTIIGAVVGIFDAWNFGDTAEDKELMKVGMGKWDAFTSGFLKTMTFGLVDLKGNLEEITKQTKELVKNTSIAQAEAFKQGAEEAKSTSAGLMEQAIKAGNKDDAMSYLVQSELQSAIAKGEIDASKMTGDQYIAAMKKFKDEARERLRPVLEQKMKEASEKAAKSATGEGSDTKFMDSMAKAQETVTKIEDLATLQEKLTKAKTKFTALNPDQLAADFLAILPKYKEMMDVVTDFGVVLGKETGGSEGWGAAQANVDTITKLVTSLATITETTGKLAKKDINVVKPLITALRDIKGGKLEITHNIPGVQMNVNVTLDSKELAKSIINVDVSKDPTKGEIRPTVGPRGVDKTIGTGA